MDWKAEFNKDRKTRFVFDALRKSEPRCGVTGWLAGVCPLNASVASVGGGIPVCRIRRGIGHGSKTMSGVARILAVPVPHNEAL